MTPNQLQELYHDPAQEVFDTVYAGFHGVASMYERPKTFSQIPPRMWPSPMERLHNKVEEIKKDKDRYIKIGKEYAKKQSYKVLKGW